jgi:hypothetical protein
MDQTTPLDSFREYSPLCVGVEQEVLAIGDPVSGSGIWGARGNSRPYREATILLRCICRLLTRTRIANDTTNVG